MKPVLYVTNVFPTFAVFVENEVWRMHQRGVPIRVLTLRQPHEHRQAEHDALLPLTRYVGSPLDPGNWAALLGWLLRRPHVLLPAVARQLWASRGSLYALSGHLGYLPAAARIASIARREGAHRIHGVWAHFPASVAYLAARLADCRFSMAAHAGADIYRSQAFLADKVRAADFVLCCVEGNAEHLRRLAGPGARVECVYHGVDRERFDGRQRARGDEPMLLCVGRLHDTKGFDTAVLALGELARRGRNACLTFIGDGPERSRLEQLAADQGVTGRVTFAGWLPQREVARLYRAAWLLLAPSRVVGSGDRDGIPNVVVEALGAGLPCVASRVAGLAEAVIPGHTGDLVPPDDATALAAAIERLLDRPQEIDRLGVEAQRVVSERFDVERNFERLYRLFESDGRDDRTVAPEAAR